jgi:hypothetical protein
MKMKNDPTTWDMDVFVKPDPIPAHTNRHVLEIATDVNGDLAVWSTITIHMFCVTCGTATSLPVSREDVYLDANLLRQKYAELRNAHIYAREPALV